MKHISRMTKGSPAKAFSILGFFTGWISNFLAAIKSGPFNNDPIEANEYD